MSQKVGLYVEYKHNTMVKLYLVNSNFVSGYDMERFPIKKGSQLVSEIKENSMRDPDIVVRKYDVWPSETKFVYLNGILVGAFIVTMRECKPLAYNWSNVVHSHEFFEEWYSEMKEVALDRFEFRMLNGKLQTCFHLPKKVHDACVE